MSARAVAERLYSRVPGVSAMGSERIAPADPPLTTTLPSPGLHLPVLGLWWMAACAVLRSTSSGCFGLSPVLPPMVYYPREVTMDHKNDCLICGKPLTYLGESRSAECVYCKKTYMTDALCEAGHYVCDACHSAGADDLIEGFCLTSEMTDPVEMACLLMKSPQVKMHGPEHHFLVPAVFIRAYYNALGKPEEAEPGIRKARQRAEKVLGGFCGFYGDCGAAVGTGIAVSVITGSTPLSKKEWKQSNLVTARSLLNIANHGGPRCCKRNSFLAIVEAVKFLKEEFGVELEVKGDIACEFDALNRECLKEECPYYRAGAETTRIRPLF